jgi:hypothetical protein
MMNEVETAALAVLVDAHGVGDVLLALSHLCATRGRRTARARGYSAQICQQAAAQIEGLLSDA